MLPAPKAEEPKARRWGVPCSIEGCYEREMPRGLCSMHYARLRRLGNAEAMVRSYRRGIVDPEENQRPWKVGTMDVSIVDQLVVALFERTRNLPMAMRAAGHSEEEISAAWRDARVAGFTEPTGLGMDRLTPAGKARASEVRDGTDLRSANSESGCDL